MCLFGRRVWRCVRNIAEMISTEIENIQTIPSLRVTRWAGCFPLHSRHNGRDNVSNHQPHDCLLNRLFRRRSKKAPELRITGLCAGNSPGTGEFPAQMASNAENISIRWRHHAFIYLREILYCSRNIHTVRPLLCLIVVWYRSILPLSFSPSGSVYWHRNNLTIRPVSGIPWKQCHITSQGDHQK